MNQSESLILSGHSTDGEISPQQLADRFLKRGVKEAVIITLGKPRKISELFSPGNKV
jgi:hypothetical protein